MKYLLDTNTCIHLLNGNDILKNKVRKMGIYSLSISNGVLAELYYGAYYSKKVRDNIQRIEIFKKHLSVLPDSEESAKHFGKIKAALRVKGLIIDDFDILIASIAIANNFILVTNNTDHFKRIEGLQIQDWLKLNK